MNPKKITTTNNVFQNIVRTIVREEVKNEIGKVEKRLDDKWDWRFSQFDERMDGFEGKFGELEDKLAKFRDEIMTAIDQITGMFKKHEEEHLILTTQHKRVINLEEKVDSLEKIHPQGKHVFV